MAEGGVYGAAGEAEGEPGGGGCESSMVGGVAGGAGGVPGVEGGYVGYGADVPVVDYGGHG